jgi:hypothetical protein
VFDHLAVPEFARHDVSLFPRSSPYAPVVKNRAVYTDAEAAALYNVLSQWGPSDDF